MLEADNSAAAGPWFLRPVLWLTDRFRNSSRLFLLCAVLVLPGVVATAEFAMDANVDLRQRMLTLALTLTGTLLALWLASAIWWRSRHDVDLTLAAVTAIAQGDLELHPLPGGRDEMGDIARSLATARQTLIDQHAEIERGQREREEQLRVGFAHQRDAERLTRERAQALIDDAATAVLAELEALVAQVESVHRTAGVLQERVATAESVTRSVVDEAAAADQGALALGDSLREVAGMAAIIGGIAGQTKLLALNATIEAARAGAVGQGFTVVADEVKTLAGSTAQSTERITATLGALESDAARVGAAITSVGTGIATLDDATSALSDVATEQRSVVAHLQAVLSATIARVQQLSNLADQLERRRAERQPITGSCVLTISGLKHSAEVADLSTTGMRCVLAAPVSVSEGTSTDATITVKGQRLELHGMIVRASGANDPDLGIQFIGLSAQQAAVMTRLLGD